MSDAGVLLLAKIVQAQAEIEAMKITNEDRARRGHAPAYSEGAFLNVMSAVDNAVVAAINSPGFSR